MSSMKKIEAPTCITEVPNQFNEIESLRILFQDSEDHYVMFFAIFCIENQS